MDTEHTTQLLRRRFDLTGEPFNRETVEAWADALGDIDFDDALRAVVVLARDHTHIAFAHVYQAARPRYDHTSGGLVDPDDTPVVEEWTDGAARAYNAFIAVQVERGRTLAEAEELAADMMKRWRR